MRFITITLITMFVLCSALFAETLPTGEVSPALKGLKFEGLYYLSYQDNFVSGPDNSAFQIKRGYLTVKKDIHPILSSRITMDTYQETMGDMKVRLKYVYALFKFGHYWYLTNLNMELGQVHTPWLDFEQHINYYRMQDTMFMERVGIFNSGDFGFTFGGYLGGEIDEAYQKKVNKKYPGKYGSFALGLYNGGGYHASEKNLNKIFQGRITVRPAPSLIPGLQFSYLNITGEGNVAGLAEETPDWRTDAVMLSFEYQYTTITAQYVTGEGKNSGSWLNADGKAAGYEGYSVFTEGKFGVHWRSIARYDYFDLENNSSIPRDRIILGAGYDFGHHNILLLDYEIMGYKKAENKADESRLQLTMQVNY